MIPTLHINLPGGFQLFSGETPVSDIDIPRVQSLLAYLLLHSGVPQSRTHLAYLFWPDSTESQAHTNLRNVIHKLRQIFPNADAFLHIDRQTLSWKPATQDAPWTLDVLDFEKAIGEAEQARDVATESRILERVVKLYRGICCLVVTMSGCSLNVIACARHSSRDWNGLSICKNRSVIMMQPSTLLSTCYDMILCARRPTGT